MEDRVERPEQPDHRLVLWFGTTGEIDQSVAFDQLRPDCLEAAPRLTQGDPGPLGEVTIARRPVTSQITPRQFGQRRL